MVQLQWSRCGQVLSWLLYFPHQQVVAGGKLWQAAAGDETADASGQSVAAEHCGLRRLLSHPVTLGKPEMSLKNHRYVQRTPLPLSYSGLILWVTSTTFIDWRCGCFKSCNDQFHLLLTAAIGWGGGFHVESSLHLSKFHLKKNNDFATLEELSFTQLWLLINRKACF